MPIYQFWVYFSDGVETVFTGCAAQAKILAQAKRINAAKNWQDIVKMEQETKNAVKTIPVEEWQ